MNHEKLYYMKECLIHYVEQEMCNLPEVNAEELGEAIDMIKDLEEAIYYCTITEAMNSDKQKDYEFNMEKHKEYREEPERMYYGGGRNMYEMPRMDEMSRPWEDTRMYYNGNGNSGGNGSSNSGSTSDSSGRSNYSEPMSNKDRDYREGRSPESRRMYMEGRDSGHDKANQLRELEKYMQELSQDIVEMIQEASPDEKQYLEKKLVALSSKIGQMK